MAALPLCRAVAAVAAFFVLAGASPLLAHGVSLSVAVLPTSELVQVEAEPTAEPEVRQIVTFRFAPGRSAAALAVYREQLKPIYQAIPDLERFRGFSEVESPEPLDLIVVSSYRGMAGMDRANRDLRKPGPNGLSALALYGNLAGMTESHHDQFVEILPAVSDSGTGGGLTVFEYIHLLPGHAGLFEALLARRVRPFERRQGIPTQSVTGRMLVSDRWNYLRIHQIASLGDWHRYRQALRRAGLESQLDGMIAAQKTIIVREVPEIGVR